MNFGTFGLGFMDSAIDPSKGTGFQAQGVNPANQILTTNSGQLDSAYAGSNYGIDQQRSFLQNLGSFDSVGNANSLYGQQQGLLGQQQGLANQLQTQAMGGGPNPAMDQLALTTGQNVQNQAALMAGQRGARGNPGLMARQIASQGAQTQQSAAGQAAVMRANQQLAAQQALGQQQGMMGSQMGNMGNTNAAMMNARQNALSGYNQSAQNEQNLLLGAATANNAQNIGMQSNINNANAGIAQQNASTQGAMTQGTMGGIGSVLMMPFGGGKAHGGVISAPPQNYADGGSILAQFSQPMSPGATTMNTELYQPHLSQAPKPTEFNQKFKMPGGGGGGGGAGDASYIPTSDQWAEAMQSAGPLAVVGASNGGKVPGNAQFGGDDQRNDTVNARLSPGEVVIPRTKVHDEVKIATFLNDLLGTNLRPGENFSKGGQANPKLQQSRMNYADGGEAQAPYIDPNSQAEMFKRQLADMYGAQGMGQAGPVATSPMPAGYPQPQQPTQPALENIPIGGKPNQSEQLPQGTQRGSQAPITPAPQGDALKQYGQAQTGLLGGLQKEYGAQRDAADQVSSLLNSDDNGTEALINDHAETLNKIKSKMDDVAGKIGTGELNYNRVWDNTSIPGKVMGILGMIVGGMGAGRDGRNPAVEMLNNLTERDVRQQQDELGKKKSQLDAFVKEYGTVESGMKALRLEKNAALAAQIDKISAKYKGTEIEGRLQALSNQIKQQQIPEMMNLANAQTASKFLSQGNAAPSDMIRFSEYLGASKEERSKMAEEYGNASKTMKAHQTADQIADELSNLQSLSSRGLNPLQSQQLIAAKKAELVPLLMEANPSKRLTHESLSAEIDPLIAKFTSSKATHEELRKGIHRLIDTHAAEAPTMDVYRIPPPKYAPVRKNSNANTAGYRGR